MTVVLFAATCLTPAVSSTVSANVDIVKRQIKSAALACALAKEQCLHTLNI